MVLEVTSIRWRLLLTWTSSISGAGNRRASAFVYIDIDQLSLEVGPAALDSSHSPWSLALCWRSPWPSAIPQMAEEAKEPAAEL
jgi:hypothetical protein